MRDKVTFEPNVPQVVTLEHDGGKPSTSTRSGRSEWMYTLQGGRIMWVDDEVNALIDRTRAGKGDTVEITRVDRREGSQRIVSWDVKRVWPDAPKQRGNAFQDDHREEQAARSAADQQAQNGRFARPATMPADLDAEEKLMQACLCRALRAASNAEQLAEGLGLQVRFTAAEVTSMGLSIFINESRGGKK